MNKITRQTMVDYVLREVARGSIYVWGAQGERGNAISESWIRKKETSTANANRAINLWNANKKKYNPAMIGAFDCSGLIGACLNENGNRTFDDTADGYLGRCIQIGKGELQPGDLVFEYSNGKSSHVGVYVGDGWVVEARGRDYGVVKTQLNARNWKKYGRPDFMYTDAQKPAVSAPVESAPSVAPSVPTEVPKPVQANLELPDGILYFRLVTTARAYLRSAPNMNNSIKETLDADVALRYRGEDGNYYCISVDGTNKKGYIAKSLVRPAYLPKTEGVKALQSALGVNADGLFGRATALAVGAVQKAANLVVDYIYGPNTKRAMETR